MDYLAIDDDVDGWIDGCVVVHIDLTSLKAIVVERTAVLGRQVHYLSYKVVDGGVGNDGRWIWMVL